MSAQHATCEVSVTIAISENGIQRCCMAGSHWIQQQREHAAFLQELRNDKQLWTVKTIKVGFPMPIQFEDLGEQI